MAEEKTFAASLGIEAYTAEELGFTMSGKYDAIPKEAIPEGKKDAYLAVEENIKNAAASRIAANAQRAMAEGPGLEAGVTISGYEYVDIMCVSPQKLFISPPWINLPHKIVAGNEWVQHRAILLINPLPGPLGTPTGRHVLGSRDVRITFNLWNITTGDRVTPPFSYTGAFSGLAPTVTTWPYWVFHPDPGPFPHIFELNVTFDCLDPEQPYAAFATRWWDVDTDPGWPWWLPGPSVPPVFPGWRVQTPLRYMVFTE